MRFSRLLTARCSLLFIVVVAVSILSIGCGGSETTSGAGSVISYTGSVTLSWQAPSTYEDGSPLTDIAGYKVYYGKESGAYSDFVEVVNYTSASIGGLPVGIPLYFSVTAYDLSGSHSTFSSEVSTVISES